MDKDINVWQKKIFWLCWFAYTFAYLCRINLPVAVPLIENLEFIDKSKIGMIGSSFFWIYAFGQLINGRLGDKFRSRFFIFTGLFFSAILNILFGFAAGMTLMIVIWGLNGYFQSMLWGPIIKTLHRWFSEEQRPKVALYIFSTVISGFIITWGILAQITNYAGWQSIFLISGSILLVFSIIWLIYARSTPEEAGIKTHNNETGKRYENISFIKVMKENRLYSMMISCIPLGFIREGIGLWAPLMIFERFDLNLRSTMGAALFIPFFNFLGVIAARIIIPKFIDKESKPVNIFFISSILSLIMLYVYGSKNIIVFVLLMAWCSLSLYGGTSIITSVIPLKYHMASSVAGALDFSIYLGAGISSVVTGVIAQFAGWQTVIIVWILVAAVGIISINKR